MSDIDVLRDLYEHWQRGELATGALFDPDVQYARIGAGLGDLAGEWQGIDAMWGAILQWLQAWEDLSIAPERFIELDDGRVLVLDRQAGRGRSSSIMVERQLASIFTLRDGKVTRLVSYWHRADAARDAGLRTEDLA